jgi:hypothetical protein
VGAAGVQAFKQGSDIEMRTFEEHAFLLLLIAVSLGMSCWFAARYVNGGGSGHCGSGYPSDRRSQWHTSFGYNVSFTWNPNTQVFGLVDTAPGRMSYWTPGRNCNDGRTWIV